MMFSQKKINAMNLIRQEFNYINSHPSANIGVTVGIPDETNPFHWTATMIGPKDTSYKSGFFILDIDFPDDYPDHPPEICFRTPIYHVNVNPNKSYEKGAETLGHICISTLNWWSPEYRMMEVLTNIFGLFYMANPESPYGRDRASEFTENRALHEEKIVFFTKKYANPRNANIETKYNQSWDFSYGY